MGSIPNRKLVALAGAAALVLVVLVFGRFLTRGATHATTTDANAAAAVAVVLRTNIGNSLSIAGDFVPYQEIEMHAKVSGYVRKINVDIGDRVKTGQVLAILEVPELMAQVEGAKAGVRRSEQEVLRAQNEMARDEAQFTAVHANAQRLNDADRARPGLIAQQELDDANAKDRAAAAQVESAKSALSAARQQLEMAQANHTQVAAMSDYTRIVAPFDGVVTWRYADTGALVQAGTTANNSAPVVKLAQVDVLRLRIPVPESIAAKVKIGDIGDVAIQATGEHFTGKVTRFTDALDPSTRTMQVEIDVPNPNYHLQPGMYASVRLDADNRTDVLAVPVEAIQRTDNDTSVLIVDSQNKVQLREVTLGVQGSNRVEVVSGLSQGERVIVGSLSKYQPGETVAPKVSTFPGETQKTGAN